ncbi:MAG: hypothetical protein EON58_00890 [Alphaproteobacteria bacterium]|nr:MAG: hypothetical protein EON58_00890 [Alphaproteobacteria bacterium]
MTKKLAAEAGPDYDWMRARAPFGDDNHLELMLLQATTPRHFDPSAYSDVTVSLAAGEANG